MLVNQYGKQRVEVRAVSKNTETTRKRYNRVAHFYDFMEGMVEGSRYSIWREILWSKVEGKRVLEVGVGTGKNFPYYPIDKEVIAIDFSDTILSRARLGSRHQYCPVCGEKVNETIRLQQERRRMRVLSTDQGSINILKHYLDHTKSHFDDEMLFNISRHRAWQIVRDCASRTGLSVLINSETGRIRGISPHRLRDAFSVHAMKRNNTGDGLRLLQEHLGHASFNTTAKYRKIAGTEHRQWYDHLWDDKA